MYILSLILFNCVVLFGQSVAQYCLKSETGVEYYGGSQKGFPLYYFNATLNQCCYYCRTTTGCLAWTFNANDLTCSFYSSLPAKRNAKNKYCGLSSAGSAVSTTTAKLGTTTIKLGTTTTPKHTSFCGIEKGVNYPGNDLIEIYVKDISDCCNKCASNPSCVAFAFQKLYSTCWLKNKVNSPTDPNKQTDSTIDFGTIVLR